MPNADVVIGGPPCQGFSNLGTQIQGSANKLWRELRAGRFSRPIPKLFVLENVDRLSKSFGICIVDRRTHRRSIEEVEALHVAGPQRC